MRKCSGFFKGYKNFIQNCGWLYLLQITGYLFPLLVVPYLMRMIGVDKYGMIAIAQAIMMYMATVTDYGFNLTVTRRIVGLRGNWQRIRLLFNDVLMCKFLLLGGSFIVYVIFIGTFVQDSADWLFYVCSFVLVIEKAIFPVWFFQGIEDMKYVTVVNLLAKSLYLGGLILWVHQESDYFLVLLIQGASGIIAGVISLAIAYKKYGMYLYRFPSLMELVGLLREGKPVFISNACGSVYGQGSVLIIGVLSGHAAAGYYALGQKLSTAMVSMIQPLVQAIYPRLCNQYEKNVEDFAIVLRRSLYGMAAFSALIFLGMVVGAEWIAQVIQGKPEYELAQVIRLFSFVTVGTILNVFLHPFILAMGEYHRIQRVYMTISLIFIGISIPLTFLCQYWGMIFSLIVVEYFILFRYMKIIVIIYRRVIDHE